MSEYESDFTSENQDDTSRDGSRPPRTNRNGSPVKPGQRGRGKRELGEKPLVTIKWDEAMTNQLWQMIKDDLELRPVLATETTKSLIAPTKSSITYSKKDLQRRIAEILWKDTHDTNDPQILENLTRAVKNKIHKTYMLYDQVIKGLGSEFIHYKSEIDVPPESQPKWAKSKERFPTFFAFQALKQDYEESEMLATSIPDGLLQSPFYHNRLLLKQFTQNQHHSLVRLSGEALAEVPPDFGLDIEVVPPPADLPSDLSDCEPVHGFSANHPSRSPSHSPFAQPGPLINPHSRQHLDAGGRRGPAPGHTSKQSSTGSTFSFSSVSVSQPTSPLQDSAPPLPGTPSSSHPPPDGASSQTRVGLSTEPTALPYPIPGADRIVQSPLLGTMISASPTALPASPLGLGFTPNLENLNLSPGSLQSSYQGALVSTIQASALRSPHRRTARRPRDHFSPSNGAVGQSGNITSKPATFSPQQLQHALLNRLTTGAGTPKSPLGSNQTLATHSGTTGGSHRRSYSDSMDAPSTFSEQRELSQSPSPPLPNRDSPPLTAALETLIDLHREKEAQKRKREELWVEHKRKRYEDRQRQREENERQRQENERQRQESERQRQHHEKMMEMKLELARLSAAKERARAEAQQAQSQAKSPSGSGTGNGSGGKSQVPLPGSTVTSPTAVPPPLNGADMSPVKSPSNTSKGMAPTSTNAGDTTVAADLSGGGLSLGLSLDVSQPQYSPSPITGGYSGLPFTGIEQRPQSNQLQNRSSLLQPKYASIQQQLSRQFTSHAQHQQAYLAQRPPPPVQIPPPQPQAASAMDTPASMSLGSMLPYEEFSLAGYDYPMSSLSQQHTPSQQQHLALTGQPYQSPAMHQQMQLQMHQPPQGQFMGGHDHSGLVLGLDGPHPSFDMFPESLLMILPSPEHQHQTSQEQVPHHQTPYYHSNG